MRLLSTEAYQDRINPWLNNDQHLAYCLPIPYARFRSSIARELFFFGALILLVVAMSASIELLFSISGSSASAGVVENLSSVFRNPGKLILGTLFALIYTRVGMFLMSKLHDKRSISVFGFLMIMSTPFIVESNLVVQGWMDGKTVQYENPSQSTLMVVFVVAFAIARKQVQQFENAKNKYAVGAN